VAILRRYIDENYVGFADQRDGKEYIPESNVRGFIIGAEKKEFCFTSEQFERAVAPFRANRACDALKSAGVLVHDSGTNKIKRPIQGKGDRPYVYCVSYRIFDK
jgi:hypothetical protein